MDKPAVRRVLQTLPKDLNETYDRILQNIPHTRVHNAIKLLQLLIFSRRPLLLSELVDAIATEPDAEPPFAFEDRVDPAKAIIEYCPSLVVLTTTNKRTYDRNGIEFKITIQLAHFSVQEYLLLDREENPYQLAFTKEVAHTRITQVCLAYMCTAARASRAQPNASEFRFTDYAVDKWPEHAKIAGDSGEMTFEWARELFTSEKIFQYWLEYYTSGSCLMDSLSEKTLYYASEFDLCRSVKHLLEAHADVGGSRHELALMALMTACKFDSIETVRFLLLDRRVNPNHQYRGQSALHIAANAGHVRILHLLLDHDADVNAQAGDYGSVLTSACRHAPGHISREIVQCLLNNGAKVNIRGGSHGPALYAASTRGDVGVVEMLIRAGADVNDAGGKYGSASLNYYSVEVVQMLRKNGFMSRKQREMMSSPGRILFDHFLSRLS